MPKQVIDITNPNEENQEEFQAVLASVESKKTKNSKKKSSKKKPESENIAVKVIEKKEMPLPKKKQTKNKERIMVSFSLPAFIVKVPLIILIVVALLGGSFLYLTLQANAEVQVKPFLEPIKIEDEIKVSSSQAEIDLENKIIPGQVIEKEIEKWETFKATGKGTEQSGAQGAIFVYNNINPPTPLNLKEGTRFISSKDGKVYKSKNKISLPQATLVNGKLTPSITEVQVVAGQEGEEYNIAPAKFSVPGLAGTALYYNVWGESREKIDGGAQKEVTEITQEDIELSQSKLTESLKQDLTMALKSQVPEGFYLKPEAISFNEPEISCSQEVKARVSEFNCYLKLKAKTIIFKEIDLSLMAKNFIDSKLSPTKKLQEQSLLKSITPKGGITEKGDMAFSLKVEANLYNAIDLEQLKIDLADKSKDEMDILLKSAYLQIEKIEVKLWPFWMKKAPKNFDKVKLNIAF